MNRHRSTLASAVILSSVLAAAPLLIGTSPISMQPVIRFPRRADARVSAARTHPVTAHAIRTSAPPRYAAPTPNTPLQSSWLRIASSPTLRHASISACAYDLTTHRALAALHPAWRETPASVIKLFTSAAALHTLGQGYQYRTVVRVGSTSGTSSPTIYLVGGGDPWLEADGALNLENMARIVSRSIHDASQVVGVGGSFAGSPHGVGWTRDDLPSNWAPNISSLTSERDQLNLLVKPAARVGLAPVCVVDPLNPSIDPTAPFLTIRNRAMTVSSTAANTLTVTREPGSNVIMVTGSLPIGSENNSFFSLHNPALLTSTLFQDLLLRDGVHFTRSPATGVLPRGTSKILTHLSPRLGVYLQIQNTYSINLMAENLFRTLGTVGGGNGSSQASADALRHFVRQVGLSSHYVQADGSGLSPLDEVSAAQVVDLLRYAHTQSWFTTFEHSLIHIGRTNQCSFMCGLMDYTPADGHVWLKTGNLGNQWNYAGYARAQNGDLIAFAILVNGLRTNQYFHQASGPNDAMTVAVATWPHLAAPASTAPAGTATPPEPLAALLPQDLSSHDIVSGQIVNVRTGQIAASYNPHMRLAPGLLPRLPAVFTYLAHPGLTPPSTAVYRTGPIANGTLEGSIVLSGSGSPLLQYGDLKRLARAVAAAGVRSVSGSLEFTLGSPATGASAPLPASLPWEDFPQASGTSTGAISPVATNHSMMAPLQTATPPAGVAALGWQATRRFSTDLWTLGVKIGNLRRTPIAHASVGVRIGALPPVSATQIAHITLTRPSARLPLTLAREISHAGLTNAISRGPIGAADLLPEFSGLGMENYMTAASVSRLLRAAWNRPLERPLARTLGANRLWVSATPEQWAAAGYITTAGQTYAVSLLINGLPWNGSFSPTVRWESTPAHWRP